ncbi:uncharacterized protein LOC136066605 [Quercus suber]|uniref:uncharacterized protein LOC136066605 n=1 Tax=Quercus suber TaxID=58331 RepID=UPI0032DFF988
MKCCKKTPKNSKLTHPDIQKDIVNAIAYKTTDAIIEDLGNGFFSILVDESRDISIKEQMAVVLRHVDKKGIVTERFLGIVHVAHTSALSLKAATEFLFNKYALSLSRLRGQGYDGANNMQGEFNGLKTLILKENKSAFYVHCFAHQLQLILVAVANKHTDIAEFFSLVSKIVTIIEASCKRREFLRNAQLAKITEALNLGELESGQGLNQETSLKRAGDTRWGSHYRTILNLILMFSSTVDILEMIEKDSLLFEQRVEARSILSWCEATMQRPTNYKFASLLCCGELESGQGLNQETSLKRAGDTRWGSHYRTILNLILMFSSTVDILEMIEKDSLLFEQRPFDFSETNVLALDNQLQTYIVDMCSNDEFLELKGIGDLARKMVETKKDVIYPLVYLLVKLVLILPIATATVERSFSAMKYIKNELRNRREDQWLNNFLTVYIEKNIARRIDNESIMQRFQNMKPHRRQL